MEEKVKRDKKLSLKYHIITKIGSGSFGTVFKATNQISHKQVALKIEFGFNSHKSNLIL